MSDFIKWAKERGILVGPGRGSAAGSLVAYCIGITDLDPIPFGLLFERFLNPDRISMPDIDIDFQDDRRNEVIDYVREKYGDGAVSKIITFNTLAARAVFKDVARVFDLTPSYVNQITKLIPAKPKMTLAKAYEESVDFRKAIEGSPDLQSVYNIALRLEGLPRNPSQHACGVIISDGPVRNYIPLSKMENIETEEKELTSQYTMKEVEEMGLLKMDFLGLRTLRVISNGLELINEKRLRGGEEEIHYMNVPIDDPLVYTDIAKGESYGVFQLESAGMRAFMKELFYDAHQFKKPSIELFERLIAGVSLYRPGPMEHIPEYIENMRNPKNIKYDHPLMKDVLGPTYGVIVYQEQTMQIVRSLAGFTKGEADNVRKAFAKKDDEETIVRIGKKFIDGCVANNIDASLAQHIWDKMKSFASYGFNKSHAAVYSMLTAKTAWMKYYYPLEFMTAILNSYIGKNDKLQLLLSVLRSMDIKVLPPNINHSQGLFSVEEDGIRFGLRGIKSVGSIGDLIKEERSQRGAFKSIQDFGERMSRHQKFNKGALESLIYVGAFDDFEGTRNGKIQSIDTLNQHLKELRKAEAHENQITLFDFFTEEEVSELNRFIEVPDVTELDKKVKLFFEKEYAGLYVTEHPLDEYEKFFEGEGITEISLVIGSSIEEVVDESEDEYEGVSEGVEANKEGDYEGKNVRLAGIIGNIDIKYTKRDQKPIWIFEIEDYSGKIKAVMFERDLKNNMHFIKEGAIVIVEGKVSIDDFGVQLIAKQVLDIEELERNEKPKLVWVKVDKREEMKEFMDFISLHPGETPVRVVYGGKAYQLKQAINLTYGSYAGLENMFGNNRLKIDY